jgi:hypothetical protein
MRRGNSSTFDRRLERAQRNRERSLRSVLEAQQRALQGTRFWQFRKRKKIRKAAEELERDDALRWARYEGLLGQRAQQMPFVRALKGIMPRGDRYTLARIAGSAVKPPRNERGPRRGARRWRGQQEREMARSEADRLLAEMEET